MQELSVWSTVLERNASSEHSALRPASLAMRAFAQLCAFAPDALTPASRLGWSGDARVFSQWLDDFLALCKREKLLSASQLPLALSEYLRQNSHEPSAEPLPELLLVGFDRLTPTQRRLLDLTARWQIEDLPAATHAPQHRVYPDATTEITACFQWIRASIETNPGGRWLILAPRADDLRGPLERALDDLQRKLPQPIAAEFTHGPPLASVPIVRAALLLLRWLTQPLSETELLWLLTTGCFTASAAEQNALLDRFASLQRGDFARTEWSLEAFSHASPRAAKTDSTLGWSARILAAAESLSSANNAPQDTWSTRILDFLSATLWLDNLTLDSAAYQALDAFHSVLDDCAAIRAVSSAAIPFTRFLAILQHHLDAQPFTLETPAPQLQIASPAESAGLVADGIWFLGADSAQWPGIAHPNPLLPLALQIQSGMPHASLDIDIDHASALTHRFSLVTSELRFSFAALQPDGARFPSAPVVALAGPPVATDSPTEEPCAYANAVTFVQDSAPPLPPVPGESVHGGASVLTDQSLCAFRAFAAHRLDIEAPRAAEPGISASLRGHLLHSALSRIWGGDGGLRTLDDLLARASLEEFVALHVAAVFARMRDALQSETISPALVEIERQRLTDLLCEWLQYEAARHPFTVLGCEVAREVEIAGMRLRIRVDRMDRLDRIDPIDPSDGLQTHGEKILILDYKTSEHKASAWLDERPDDAQLPLYTQLYPEDELAGLVFANIVPADNERGFRGLVRNARESLLPDLSTRSALVTRPLTTAQLKAWRSTLENLAQDFLHGHAAVNPKKYPKTCERCGLQSLCRVASILGNADADDPDFEADEEDA